MDEVIRCYYCNTPAISEQVNARGMCGRCGSRKFRNAPLLTDDEMASLVASGFDPAAHGWEHSADA